MNAAQQYAIVDIETTGGYASGNGITEIAILIYDGSMIIERYQKLINPQQAIPFSIQMLTGINDELVKDCPTFEEVAEEIYSMLEGRIFVAHNVNFDYSFVKHHLEVAGYKLFVQKICTVRLSRKIKPGLSSYSLGKLCDVLQIPLTNRHRAAGDAEATAILFSRLMGWDTENHIQSMLKKVSKEQQLPPNLSKKDIDTLPTCPGVYYFRDSVGKVIYVGKAVNIQKRVFSHFTGHTPQQQRQEFLRTIYSITYETCGTELMALLLEATEIKRLWPTYNRALKRFEPKFGLYSYEDQNGYLRLAIGKVGKYHSCIQVFNTAIQAANQLNKLIIEFNLRRELCTFAQHRPLDKPLEVPVHSKFSIHKVSVKDYNELVHNAVNSLKCGLPSFVIKDKGRNDDERSCIWVEKGNLYGMGYIDNASDLHTCEDIKESLTPYNSNHYMMQLIYSYATKYPGKVLYIE